MKPDCTIRQYNPTTDEDFIHKAWKTNFRESDFGLTISNQVYYTNMDDLIKEILNTSQVYLLVSTPEADKPELFFGFIAFEYMQNVPVIHFLYIKYHWRNFGLGTDLLNLAVKTQADGEKEPFIYTFHSFAASNLRKKFRACIHNPFIALTKIWRRYNDE